MLFKTNSQTTHLPKYKHSYSIAKCSMPNGANILQEMEIKTTRPMYNHIQTPTNLRHRINIVLGLLVSPPGRNILCEGKHKNAKSLHGIILQKVLCIEMDKFELEVHVLKKPDGSKKLNLRLLDKHIGYLPTELSSPVVGLALNCQSPCIGC